MGKPRWYCAGTGCQGVVLKLEHVISRRKASLDTIMSQRRPSLLSNFVTSGGEPLPGAFLKPFRPSDAPATVFIKDNSATQNCKEYAIPTALTKGVLPRIVDQSVASNEAKTEEVVICDEVEMCTKERKLATSYRMQIWKVIFRCLARTSLHGFPYIALSLKSALKLTYWIILIMMSLACLIYSLVAISVQFAERRTFLSSSHHFPKQLPFPSITLCNLNSFKRSLVHPDISIEEMILFLNYISAEPFLSQQFDVDAFVQKYDQAYGGDRSFLANFGHDLRTMLVLCYFENRPCTTADFDIVVTSLGVCYTFNSGKNRSIMHTDQHGYENGLQLILNAEEYEYFTAEDDSTGLYVFVHAPGVVPYIGTYGGFTVSAGQRTQVSISKTDFKLIPPPYGKCNDHVTLEWFNDYSRESCLIECETRSAVRFCGCKAEFMPGNTIVCSLNETVRCLLVHSAQFQPQFCDCPVPCESVDYTTKFSFSKYPSAHFFSIINTTAFLNNANLPLPEFILSRTTINGSDEVFFNSNASNQFLTDNLLAFYIYYETLENNVIEEVVEYNLFQYIADFGGFMGFFTGAGFLTFFEMIELLYGAMYPSID